jgi:hypothetical protein
MSKKISEIYSEYKIMPNLQEHMLRVAAVAAMVCDNLNETVEKEDIIKACLLHDMGNIIKFDLNYFPEFTEKEGLKYWQEVKNQYIKKYGDNEDEATIKILEGLSLSRNIIELVSKMRFSLLCEHAEGGDLNVKIVHYADSRVGPYGILSYDERMEDGNKRYKNHKDSLLEEERLKLVECGREIERQIFSKCKIKPEYINDETAEPIISNLRDFIIF